MIFVTVGTHEQQFDRLAKAVDQLKADGSITESVFIQTGYSTYEPQHCAWEKFVSAARMKELMADADVVITHGGPSSFVEAMAAGKMPVVVPRLKEYGEHVNNHQSRFLQVIEQRMGGIIPVYDIDDLLSAIKASKEGKGISDFKSNNAQFCTDLKRLIEEI